METTSQPSNVEKILCFDVICCFFVYFYVIFHVVCFESVVCSFMWNLLCFCLGQDFPVKAILNLNRNISCKIKFKNINKSQIAFNGSTGWTSRLRLRMSESCRPVTGRQGVVLEKSPKSIFGSAFKQLLIKSRPTGENFIQVKNNLVHWDVFGTERCITSNKASS